MSLVNKNILLGVTGGIAAYKCADLTRRLRDSGAQVRVAMTESATEFVTPLTFQALSGNPVHTTLLDPQAEAAMGHIELARWADAVLIAPASANFIARLAHGLADDLLSTICLATEAPIALAPAMNRVMWSNQATRHNASVLERRGIPMFGPGEGNQACGEVGAGRMLEPLDLVDSLSTILSSGKLQGIRVLITAGPTREALDPVRYITNRSSGRMGFALALSAREAGAVVTLVSGPVAMPAPHGIKRIDVESAQEMFDAVMTEVSRANIFIACAAVSDYRPHSPEIHKIKKSRDTLSIELTKNPDIVSTVASLDPRPFVLGFAAETRDLERYARAKLEKKCLDMIAANLVGTSDTGFDSEFNAIDLFWKHGGHRSLERGPKTELARQLITILAERYAASHKTID